MYFDRNMEKSINATFLKEVDSGGDVYAEYDPANQFSVCSTTGFAKEEPLRETHKLNRNEETRLVVLHSHLIQLNIFFDDFFSMQHARRRF
jgi:hypothetical protein